MRFHDGHILPTIRLQRIELINFKSVSHGEIVFSCGKRVVPQDTESDILGIYGQNGSGKTSVIEAIAILKRAMSGESVPARYSECISSGADTASLSFTFDLQYPVDDSFTRTVTYSFDITSVPNDSKDEQDDILSLSSFYPRKVKLINERISASGFFSGQMQKKQDILTVTGSIYPIGPVRKIPYYLGGNKDSALIDLIVNQHIADQDSKSFIFLEDTLLLFNKYSNYSDYYQILLELNYYARFYLYAIDTRASASISVPFNTRQGVLNLNLMKDTSMPQHIFEDLKYFIENINNVLPTLINDLRIEFAHDEIIVKGKRGQAVRFFSRRKDVLIPLRNESAGIIKLISVLSLIIAVFNDRSITVALDELDAGIYEHLLGEILQGLESYGKGQLVFTSHNLRPLEVLNKESIVFTTSNPENRYIRLKGVGQTNNLRTLYLREILASNQDERIYDAAKRQRMIAAFMKAGVGYVKEN